MNSFKKLNEALEQNKILKAKIIACEIEIHELRTINNALIIRGNELNKKITELKNRISILTKNN